VIVVRLSHPRDDVKVEVLEAVPLGEEHRVRLRATDNVTERGCRRYKQRAERGGLPWRQLVQRHNVPTRQEHHVAR
jgi:hypothetical protein